ncbi:sulfurtransferase [soil metagenome]
MSDLLLSVDQLAARTDIRLFDSRHDLADPEKGPAAFARGHIPGALHAHIDRDLSGTPNGQNGRHPLPDRDAFTRWLGSRGVRPEDHVVVYDEDSGAFAARLWWLLRWVGHRRVSLLDGGLAAWEAAGHPLETGTREFPANDYRPAAPLEAIVSIVDVEANIDDPHFLVVDARAAGRYAGEGETIDPVGGHIPGARNRHFARNLNAQGLFKSPAELRAEFLALADGFAPEAIVHQCGSGVTACHNLFAMELAGLSGARLYPGSWSEWCSDPARPMAIGAG